MLAEQFVKSGVGSYSGLSCAIESYGRQKNNMVQIFRALAIIAVVMIHTTPLGYWQVFCRPFINFSVATFLFLSGYLTKITNNNWSLFYKKRITRVLIPYVIWTIVYTLSFGDFEAVPKNLLTAKAAVPLYYILVYIQFVLLTPLIGKLATSKYQSVGWLIAPFSITIFYYFGLFNVQESNPNVLLLWSDFCLGWFTFYYLGLILGNQILVKNYSLKILILLYVLSIVLQIAEGYGLMMLGDKNCGTQLKMTSLFTSTMFLLIAYTILKNKRFEINKGFLRLLGDYSFGIYLCHIMVINVLKAFLPFYKSIPYPITSVLVVLISFCCCYLGDKICGMRISKWIGLR